MFRCVDGCVDVCVLLCSALILKRKGCYYRGLFSCIGFAHAQGFDPKVLKELGRTEGSRVWIGAVDVAAVIFDFVPRRHVRLGLGLLPAAMHGVGLGEQSVTAFYF